MPAEKRPHWQDDMPGWLTNLTSAGVLLVVVILLFLMWTWYGIFWYYLSWLVARVADTILILLGG